MEGRSPVIMKAKTLNPNSVNQSNLTSLAHHRRYDSGTTNPTPQPYFESRFN